MCHKTSDTPFGDGPRVARRTSNRKTSSFWQAGRASRGPCGLYHGGVRLAARGGHVDIVRLERGWAAGNLDALLALYGAVGWTNYTRDPERLRAAWEGSLDRWGAFENRQLLGVARVVGDGASIAFVQDLLVFPEAQRSGVGTVLMRAVLDHYADVYQVELLTDDGPRTRAFYESLGLERSDALGCVIYVRMRATWGQGEGA